MSLSHNPNLLQPRTPILNWIADMGSDISEEIRSRLCGTLAASTLPAILGSLNSIFITLLAYARIENPVLLWIAFFDLAFGIARAAATNINWVRVIAADLVVISGIGWATMIAATMVVVGFSNDTPMLIVVVASGLGSCAGIIARNYAAPRLALIQVILIDTSFKIPFCLNHPEFTPLIVIQGMGFIGIAVWIMRQQRETTVRAIAGQIESRTQSLLDPLTGLLNRRGLEERTQSMRQTSTTKALLYLDLDGFKQVNDRFGHGVGDEILRQAARRLSICLPNASICRMGGDEFIVLADCHSRQEAAVIGARIIQTISLPSVTSAGQAYVGVSIGISLFDPKTVDLERAMVEADEALYRAKRAGRGCALLHDPSNAEASKVPA
ncbi:GGDEF domain-containing protein [Rhizobium lemnae]|uniref:diguanylate cyclase n=1 Tax=Rhizobium lemnae TaxID=1214924 RepID=A0ABV8E6A8_9HYPH|nr:GGDEF domain-containing protein [Rhizobium lemnae]MCJ8509469.1 GGDEF domain-containing protein [Rhizobium lemnae]